MQGTYDSEQYNKLKLGVTICLSQVALPIDQHRVWRIVLKIDRNLPELQKTRGHIFAFCIAMLCNLDSGLLPAEVGRWVHDGSVVIAGTSFGGERGSGGASVGGGGFEAIGLSPFMRPGVHGVLKERRVDVQCGDIEGPSSLGYPRNWQR